MTECRPRKWRLAKVGRALVVLLIALAPVTALAHTKLVRSTPKAKDVLSQPPKFIELWFTEALEPGLTTIEVQDEQNNRVDKGSVALSEANKKAALTVKFVLVVVMLLLGGVNNFYFGRRSERLSKTRKTKSDTKSLPRLEQGFRRSVVFEAALGVAVLVVTAVLVFLTPARNHPAMSPSETAGGVLLERR